MHPAAIQGHNGGDDSIEVTEVTGHKPENANGETDVTPFPALTPTTVKLRKAKGWRLHCSDGSGSNNSSNNRQSSAVVFLGRCSYLYHINLQLDFIIS